MGSAASGQTQCAAGSGPLPTCLSARTGAAMTNTLTPRILATLSRMPDWLRKDLAVKDEATRERAQEALAAMIAGALEE